MKSLAVFAPLLLVLSAPAFAQTSWLHPQPQGNTLKDIVFLDNSTAIAVGEHGTILVTHDTGTTWSVQSNVPTGWGNYESIARLDANTAVVVGGAGVVVRTTDRGATWTAVNSGTTFSYNDVSFFDALHGIAVSTRRIIRTSDGGLSWQNIIFLETLYAVDMTSATNAIAVGANTVFYTTNGGANWTPGVSPVPPSPLTFMPSVDFLDPLNGAIGTAHWGTSSIDPPRCYVTADGGATWTPSDLHDASTSEGFWPHELLYPEPGELLVAGEVKWEPYQAHPTGEFASTVDTGGLWTNTSINRSCFGLARNDDGVAIVVGEDGRITRRNLDGTYTQLGPGYVRHLSPSGRSNFFDAKTGIVFGSDGTDVYYGSGDTHFARTVDGGQTWLYSSASPAQCLDVAYLSATEIIAVGVHDELGAVLRSIDGGVSWSEIWAGPSPSAVRAVVATSSTRAVAVGTGVNALIIADGAVTVVPTVGANFNDVAFAGPSTLLAVGVPGARSADGGLTWVPIGSSGSGIRALDFVTATRAVGTRTETGGFEEIFTRILVTNDTGSTWTPVFTSPAFYLSDVSFADANWGVVAGSNGLIYTTPNGGATWQQVQSLTSRPYSAASAMSPGHAFLSSAIEDVFELGEPPVPTPVRDVPKSALELLPNQPNPFNPQTTIRFVVPERMRVTLTVHDVAGRRVATLLDAVREAGLSAVTWNADGMASGVYFARLRAGNAEVSRKMVLLK